MWGNTPRPEPVRAPARAPAPKVVRRGRAVNLTVDPDALELLRQLCPSKKGLGHLVSELIRTEVRVREERLKVTTALRAALDPETALVTAETAP
jgi:hypothetical protein